MKNKKIIIVGGTSGIGLSLTERLLQEGCEIVVASRSPEKFETTELGKSKQISCCRLDASDEKAVEKFFSSLGNFDHLISTIKPRHINVDSPFDSGQSEQIRRAFEAKFWGQYYLTQYSLKHINQGGSIILTSGIASRKGYPGFSGTAAMNGAVESFVRSLVSEISPLRINCICPGFIERFPDDVKREETVRQLGARLPLDRLGRHDEVVQAYLFLLKNAYSTGTILKIDGGELSA
jgi:NAD(P)-dependent dehydrogenase (short-subunit alcohol dehydrogenase family)